MGFRFENIMLYGYSHSGVKESEQVASGHESNFNSVVGYSVSVTGHSSGQPEVMQQTTYYPFGYTLEQSNYYSLWSEMNKNLYNGKELQDDELGGVRLDWYDYGARFYDPQIGRWNSPDPLCEVAQEWSTYRAFYCNPIKFSDPTGLFESTHTDEDGNVIAVYDDGDLGVYKHRGKGDEVIANVKANYSAHNTSAGGVRMGETLTSLGFSDYKYYEQTGKIRPGQGAKIDFNSDWATNMVNDILKENPSAVYYAYKARGGYDWDIKLKSPSGVYYGSKLYGKYASARDAGNFAAGAVAQLSNIPNLFLDYGFGTYNMSGNSAIKSFIMIGCDAALFRLSPIFGVSLIYYKALYGEDKLSRMAIESGKNYIKKK